MPKIPKHMKLSESRTGKTYRELHEWMDPWINKPELRELGRVRHDITKIPEHIPYVKEKWGEEGVKEFLFHIKEDFELNISRSIIARMWNRSLLLLKNIKKSLDS